MHVQLDNDNWVELKEISDLRRSDRKALNKAISYEVDAESGRPVIRASMDDAMAEAVLPLIVTNWSLPYPLPSADISALDALTLAQDAKIREAIAGHINALQGRDAPVKENAGPTPVSGS